MNQPWYGSEPTDWNSSEYQCNNCSHLIHHWVSRSILLWPWIIFSIPSVANKCVQWNTFDSGMATAATLLDGLVLSLDIDGFIFLFFFALDYVSIRPKYAETSSSLANRLLLPAGPKSWTEEDLRWMCRIEHCRKDGSEPKTSRNFRIF